ncbi:hypothetical protein GOV12_01695 [Candidatus Pacearchaeota archaeon]|nr:hypothetical protein [Candidatus Pacearchaeota archaeon]
MGLSWNTRKWILSSREEDLPDFETVNLKRIQEGFIVVFDHCVFDKACSYVRKNMTLDDGLPKRGGLELVRLPRDYTFVDSKSIELKDPKIEVFTSDNQYTNANLYGFDKTFLMEFVYQYECQIRDFSRDSGLQLEVMALIGRE